MGQQAGTAQSHAICPVLILSPSILHYNNALKELYFQGIANSNSFLRNYPLEIKKNLKKSLEQV